jgi:translation initiation factor 2 beta subunit (eIF-2beta)/eIF-5
MAILDRVSDEQPVDCEAVRRRFPWAGLVSTGERDLSSRYREIMAEARRDRKIVEAIDEIRRSA